MERRALRRAARRAVRHRERPRPRVDTKALVTIRQNRYSVPVALSGCGSRRGSGRARSCSGTTKGAVGASRAPARPLPDRRPARPLPRAAPSKPGALKGSLPCGRSASAAAGRRASTSSGSGSRSGLGPPSPRARWSTCCCLPRARPERVELAVRGALAAGAHDGRAVALLARRSERAGAAAAVRAGPSGWPPRHPRRQSSRIRRPARGRTMSAQEREDRGARSARRGPHGRAAPADRSPSLPSARRRGDARPADAARLPRRPARGRGRRAGRA